MPTFRTHFRGKICLIGWCVAKPEFLPYIGKYGSFSKLNFPRDRSIWVKMGIPASLESASGFPTKPWYYNLKISILKYSPNICSQNESLRKCPQKSRKIFKTDIFKFFYNGFVGDPDADSRLTGIPILIHIDRSGGKFENHDYSLTTIDQNFGHGCNLDLQDFWKR